MRISRFRILTVNEDRKILRQVSNYPLLLISASDSFLRTKSLINFRVRNQPEQSEFWKLERKWRWRSQLLAAITAIRDRLFLLIQNVQNHLLLQLVNCIPIAAFPQIFIKLLDNGLLKSDWVRKCSNSIYGPIFGLFSAYLTVCFQTMGWPSFNIYWAKRQKKPIGPKLKELGG